MDSFADFFDWFAFQNKVETTFTCATLSVNPDYGKWIPKPSKIDCERMRGILLKVLDVLNEGRVPVRHGRSFFQIGED